MNDRVVCPFREMLPGIVELHLLVSNDVSYRMRKAWIKGSNTRAE